MRKWPAVAAKPKQSYVCVKKSLEDLELPFDMFHRLCKSHDNDRKKRKEVNQPHGKTEKVQQWTDWRSLRDNHNYW